MLARSVCLAVCLAASVGAAEAAGFVAFVEDDSGSTSFVMPSGNIGCIYTPAGGSTVYMPADGGPELSCDRVAPTYLRFILDASGAATIVSNVGDPGCCGAPNTFPYNKSWRLAPFTCTSSTKGLSCKRDGGHGFFISKAKVQAF